MTESEPAASLNPSLRPARTDDLPELFRLTLLGLGAEELAGQINSTDLHPFHELAMELGEVLVAEIDGKVIGYASAIQHDNTRILSQLFVRDAIQSAGVGRLLLEAIDPPDGSQRLLQASADPRAVGLYIRRGYVPAWPVYSLGITAQSLADLPESAVEACRTALGTELVEIDVETSQRNRPEIHAYWAQRTGGTPYLLHDGGSIAGIGWIHDPLSGAMSKWYGPEAPLSAGPVGVLPEADSWACLLALLDTIRREFPGRGASIEIPGPHPGLPHLLRAGARIEDAETAMATDRAILGDPERYIPSGGILY